ncbi:MAG: aminotransferase class I/II-fold pyridoxal phosphate-dependent enzyme [Deltaproteobacteria bacterium]|nr:aminotransferase class I/II-fold pyridoxal phosphate-dependent enzyme [Deltaproteobacteria bacterium]
MALALSRNLLRTEPPPIAEVNALAADLERRGRSLVDLGQAVPDWPPPSPAIARLAGLLSDPLLHRYAPDPGLPALRHAWAAVLSERWGQAVDPEGGLLVTAGANMAYLVATLGILDPGDRVALPVPWYFNHAMATTLVGAEVVPVPLAAQDGFDLDPDRLLATARAEDCKAVTVVTPNNPTGVTADPEALDALAAGLDRDGRWLLVDETYAPFADPARGHRPPRGERVVLLGSFSKAFSLTGWRVGYLAAAPEVVAQFLKIQDTMVICAPRPGQALVVACLETAGGWIEEKRAELADRGRAFDAAAAALGAWTVRAQGSFFAWIEGPPGSDGRTAARQALETEGVVTVPGCAFGPGLDRGLRLSLGCAPAAVLTDGLVRLGRVLNAGPSGRGAGGAGSGSNAIS